jgi:phytoene dehydrogenase-like protein
VIVIGGGVAGLCCARRLADAGVSCIVLERGDRPGGRVGSDRHEDFILDRGFQVFLPAYPEAKRVLDYERLQLRPFFPGCLVRYGGRFHRLADPWKEPLAAMRSLLSPVLRFGDARRVAALRRATRRAATGPIRGPASPTTGARLRELEFSPAFIDRFFRPFFGGIFLERELSTPWWVFEFIFAMFAAGPATLPRLGMQAIPDQLATGLPPGTVQLGASVRRVRGDGVELEDGRRVRARQVVVAGDATAARPRVGEGWNGTSTIYFAAERAPIDEPILVLDGDGAGPINNLCVPSCVSRDYAPPGAELICASVIGTGALSGDRLEHAARDQLRGWFGAEVNRWRHLRTYRLPRALPRFDGSAAPLVEGLACGDHLEHPSINGAMVSGRRVAEELLESRQ